MSPNVQWYKISISNNKWLEFEELFDKALSEAPAPRNIALFGQSSNSSNDNIYYLATDEEKYILPFIQSFSGNPCDSPNLAGLPLCSGDAIFADSLKS